MITKVDYTWQVTAVNGFLLVVAAITLEGIKSHYFILDIAAPFQTAAGIIIANLFFSGVLTGILYLASRNKGQFRFRRCIIITTWVLIGLQCYPLISSSKAQSNAQALNDASNLVDTKKFAQEFVQSFYASCYQTQRASSINSGVPETFIMDYCDCNSKHILSDLTYEDIRRLEQIQDKGTPPPNDIQEKLNRAGKICMRTSIDKMSPDDLEKMDRLTNQNTQGR